MTEMPHLYQTRAVRFGSDAEDIAENLENTRRMIEVTRAVLVDELLRDAEISQQAQEPPAFENAITVLNRSGIIVCESAPALRTLGFKPGELIGKRFFDFIHARELTATYAAFLHVIEGTARDAAVRFRHLMGDGGFQWLNCTAVRIFEKNTPLAVFRMCSGPQMRTMLRL